MYKYSLDDSIGFAIARAHRALKMEVRSALLESGLEATVEQWGVLSRLLESDGRSHKELAETLSKDTPTITRMVDIMVRRGLVNRERDKEDRRVYRVYLTGEGRKLARDMEALIVGASERSFSFMDDDERRMFKNLLDRLIEHLEEGRQNV